MRLLVDNAISPIVSRQLRECGMHDAVHVGDLRMQHATDEELFSLAAAENRVILSADTDFGTLLAARNTQKPSVVLLRRQSQRRPSEQVALLLATLPRIESFLEAGAIVVIDGARVRVRMLPLFGDSRD